jgi:hypothetical protein
MSRSLSFSKEIVISVRLSGQLEGHRVDGEIAALTRTIVIMRLNQLWHSRHLDPKELTVKIGDIDDKPLSVERTHILLTCSVGAAAEDSHLTLVACGLNAGHIRQKDGRFLGQQDMTTFLATCWFSDGSLQICENKVVNELLEPLLQAF